MAENVKDQLQTDRWISDLFGVFTDPIIVMPGGWDETLPAWIKEAVTIERLLENVKHLHGEEMTATDAEAVAYLYTASLTGHIDSDWTEIYLYLAGSIMSHHQKTDIPVDIKVESLNDYQRSELKRFKRWLYETRVRARKGRNQANCRQERKEKARQREAEQPVLFNF